MACGSGCSTGCSRLGVTDWLENMLPPGHVEAQNIYEVKFKSTRKAFYRNVHALDLVTGDLIAVEAERGYDVGMVTMGGELVRLQMKKKKVKEDEVLKVYRHANEQDLKKLEQSRSREYGTLNRTRTIITELKLDMKLSEVEYQADGSRAIFYYTADQRVDFRQLIKQLATEFHIRVEMKQIGLRQESGLVGGVGSCGRELCCSSWLTDFKTVNTQAARYQNISLNPAKITGMCGRLKCCLNYELDTYMDALKDIPQVKELHTELGVAHLQKTDIFQKRMWFSYGGDANWTPMDVQQVVEVYTLNKQGVKPPSLAAAEPTRPPAEKAPDFVDVVGQSRLNERMQERGPQRGRDNRGYRRGRGGKNIVVGRQDKKGLPGKD